MLSPQLITVQDSSKGLLSPKQLFQLCWALNRQAVFHFGRSPWVERQYASPIYVAQLPEGVSPPPNSWNINLLGESDQPGALGYHDDVHGNTRFGSRVGESGLHSVRVEDKGWPESHVFVTTARTDGVDPCAVASHEMTEMAVNPYVLRPQDVRKALDKATKQFWIVEVGDPVQGNDYDVLLPEGKHSGVMVSDFAWPRLFGLAQDRADFSFRDAVKAAFTLAGEGYMNVAPESEPENWTPIYGEHAPHRKDADDPS